VTAESVSANVLQQSTGITVTILVYAAALLFQRASRLIFAHPVLVSVVLLGLGLHWTHIPYGHYFASVRLVHFFLGPATVALGFPLAATLRSAKRVVPPLVLSVGLGALFSACVGLLMMRSFGAGTVLAASMAAKSATTPIAIHIAQEAGGDGPATAVFAIAAGILVAVLGPPVLRLLQISDRLVIGAAFGTAGSGIGAAEAASIDEMAGTVAGLAIGLTGLFTAFAVPAVAWLWKSL
jgi:putative effector of murein hydrolase